jgi:hypothetical protein
MGGTAQTPTKFGHPERHISDVILSESAVADGSKDLRLLLPLHFAATESKDLHFCVQGGVFH